MAHGADHVGSGRDVDLGRFDGAHRRAQGRVAPLVPGVGRIWAPLEDLPDLAVACTIVDGSIVHQAL
jgi:hypothetical protein